MYELLVKRRSIRKYLDKNIDEETINTFLRSILRSPRGNNIDSLKFIFVDNAELIQKLSLSKKAGAKLLESAPSCLIILADENKTDIWIEDAAIATTIAHLSATSLGLGSCWIQIRNRLTKDGNRSEDYIKELLSLPSNMRVEAILSLGYPDEDKDGHSEESLLNNNIYLNGYEENYKL